ncbi:MAG TPA: 3-hydroxyacyl-CoA dehydrogenase NAD-binding domain-containing protein [Candidatus Limnocylindrales bacterium]|nr:3-hydroxyacyl-CoA dehydrogenase NAD-binding domain-containing protein [Candidatus Limnocylindrales bacterium]
MSGEDRDTVGVVGAGTMGAGIAQVCATAGLQVLLVDVGLEQLARGRAGIGASLAKLEAKGRLPRPAAEIVGRIRTSTDLADLARVGYVIEAAFEDVGVKTELFRRLDQVCADRTILASNTSSISITRLGAATARPERVVGMHFMNPVPLMAVVELVRGLRTSDETLAEARGLAERLGKTTVEARDVPGFISNRVLMPMVNEAVFALEEGVGSAEDIDAMMRGLNFPMGPLALADLIGLDVCLAILEVMQRDLGDPKYRPAPLLRRYVSAGWLGRKSGRGFHAYAAAGTSAPKPGAARDDGHGHDH